MQPATLCGSRQRCNNSKLRRLVNTIDLRCMLARIWPHAPISLYDMMRYESLCGILTTALTKLCGAHPSTSLWTFVADRKSSPLIALSLLTWKSQLLRVTHLLLRRHRLRQRPLHLQESPVLAVMCTGPSTLPPERSLAHWRGSPIVVT